MYGMVYDPTTANTYVDGNDCLNSGKKSKLASLGNPLKLITKTESVVNAGS